MEALGYINSIQSMGTVDGPGVRYTVFLQGCNLRCGCCHNPETRQCGIGDTYTAEALVLKASRFKNYFGERGGITFTGGEPLLQAKFCREVFELCHQRGINTCLDTSGSVLNEEVLDLLKECDRVLLDIKYTDDFMYKKYVGCSIETPLEFLKVLNEKNIPTTLRQVIIPALNDTEENAKRLKAIVDSHPCVDSVELLPFKKICQVKYDNMGIEFPFANFETPDNETMKKLNKYFN